MNKVLQKEIKYPSPGVYLVNNEEYQVRETGEIRERTFFAWYPVWLGMQTLIPLSGCKLTWLKRVKLTDKELEFRTIDFDEWFYERYWKKWKKSWITIKIDYL